MNNKTAIVIGATGLVGRQLVSQLIENSNFSTVTVLVRRSTKISHEKLNEVIVDFDKLSSFSQAIKGDVLFSCMGTTIKQAKTQENQFKVDYTYQYETARIAAENNISTYVLVSSTGAKSSSRVFYSRIKGELEDAVIQLAFNRIKILRPSVLMGNRNEFRLGEKIGIAVMMGLKHIPYLKKWRGIKDSEVAHAMIAMSQNASTGKLEIRELDELFDL
jgi:uncharacterized protein YbjT (DUF2867 family)